MPRYWMAWVHITTGQVVNAGSDLWEVECQKINLQMIAAMTLLPSKRRSRLVSQDSQETISKEGSHGSLLFPRRLHAPHESEG